MTLPCTASAAPGRCSCEPIVNVLIPGLMPAKYQRVDREKVHKIFTGHVLRRSAAVRAHARCRRAGTQIYEFLVCGAARCRNTSQGRIIRRLLQRKAARRRRRGAARPGPPGQLSSASAANDTAWPRSVHVLVRPEQGGLPHSQRGRSSTRSSASTSLEHQVVQRLCVEGEDRSGSAFFDQYGDVSFFNKQTRIALRNSGVIDPESLDEYRSGRRLRGLWPRSSNRAIPRQSYRK